MKTKFNSKTIFMFLVSIFAVEVNTMMSASAQVLQKFANQEII